MRRPSMLRLRNSHPRKSQDGFSMVELLIGIVVLVTGMAAILGLILIAITNNNRAKQDTGGTLAAQMVLETIASQPDVAANITVVDCANNNLTVNTAGAASPGAGANLNATGGIDFAGQKYASVPANYKLKYVSCGDSSTRVTYDVRWNIITLGAFSKLVTVSARPAQAEAMGNNATGARLYQQPVTLKTIAVAAN